MSDSVWIIEYRVKGREDAWELTAALFRNKEDSSAGVQIREKVYPNCEYRAVEYVRKERGE